MDQTNILLIITILITISAFGYILTKMNNKGSANSDNLKLFQDSIPLIKQELGDFH